jgi:hypothetical protein
MKPGSASHAYAASERERRKATRLMGEVIRSE